MGCQTKWNLLLTLRGRLGAEGKDNAAVGLSNLATTSSSHLQGATSAGCGCTIIDTLVDSDLLVQLPKEKYLHTYFCISML